MSGPITAIDVVVPEHRSCKLRREEVHLIGGLRAAEDSGRRSAVLRQIASEPIGRAIESLIPTGGTEDAVVADERLRQAGVCARRVGTGLHRVHLQDGNGVRRMHGGCSPRQVAKVTSAGRSKAAWSFAEV